MMKIFSSFGRFLTAVEIHPGAKLGEECLLITDAIVIGRRQKLVMTAQFIKGYLGGTFKKGQKRHLHCLVLS